MRRLLITAATVLFPSFVMADASCGGPFDTFVQGLQAEAVSAGIAPDTAQAFFKTVRQDPAVLQADRKQGIFQMPFTDFARRLISANRLNKGIANADKHRAIFDRVEAEYGVSRGVLLAFWALETDYGSFQGDYNTANALVTLSHDCRRPELFRPQVISAIELYAKGGFDPATTTGAWAGEIGMVQMLPRDILENGVDGDGDGQITLGTSVADALLSGAKMLRHLGWRPNEPWLAEINLPDTFDPALSGLHISKPGQFWQDQGVTGRNGPIQQDLTASVILPQGTGGPAFLAYPNLRVYFDWNQSFTYVMTAAYFATRLEGAQIFDPGTPAPGLDNVQMKQLQTRLDAMGHDVGGIDGILGSGTRAAVRAEQKRLGLPVDGWPTTALLSQL